MRAFSLCLFALFCSLYGEEETLRGCVVESQAIIFSSKIRITFEGEREYLFTLSDTSRWMTDTKEAFNKIQNDGWTVGDHLTVILSQDVWTVKNTERTSEVILIPLCNKSTDNSQ